MERRPRAGQPGGRIRGYTHMPVRPDEGLEGEVEIDHGVAQTGGDVVAVAHIERTSADPVVPFAPTMPPLPRERLGAPTTLPWEAHQTPTSASRAGRGP